MGTPAGRVLSRAAVYEMVWTKPLREAAPVLGLSDTGLAKLCDRLGIPRPKQGHWEKLRRGVLAGKRPPLPPGEDQVEVQEGPPKLARTAEAPVVVVSETVHSYHPAVRKFREARSLGPRAFSHPRDLTRPSRILEALARALEARAYRVEHVSDHRFRAFRGADDVEFQLRERIRQTRNADPRAYPRVVYAPTGELQLILKDYWSPQLRKQWSDTKHFRLEDLLGRALLVFDAIADNEQERRLARIERERREAEHRRLADIELQENEHRRRVIEALEALASDAVLSQALIEFLDRVERSEEARAVSAAWLDEAREFARDLDALHNVAALEAVGELFKPGVRDRPIRRDWSGQIIRD